MCVPSTPVRKSWTVLVYVVADHRDIPADEVAARIDQIAHDEVDNILWAADLSRVNVAVQVDFSHEPGVLRVIATGRGIERTVLPEQDAGRTETFINFIRETAPDCPADHYLFLLWGHGEGPIGFFADAHGDGVLSEGDKTLSLPELETVLAFAASSEGFGQKVDILLGKSCSLATIEAAYQLKDHVELMVCSQAIVPIKAWRYGDIFKALGPDVETTARTLLKALDRQYQLPGATGGRSEVPYSIIKPSRLDGLSAMMQALSQALAQAGVDLQKAPLLDALASARRPISDASLLDLGAFCAQLAKLPSLGSAAAAAEILALLASSESPVLERSPAGTAFHGISAFYLPPPRLRRFSFGSEVTTFDYKKLAVCDSTGWDRVAFAADGASA